MARHNHSIAQLQHRLIHDIYVMLDDGDRRVLEHHQLAPLEFAVLKRLDMHEGRRLTDIGAELLCVKSTITRIVDRLERAKLVIRTPDPDDRRAQRLTLTREGLAIRDQATLNHAEAVERRLGRLSADEQRVLSQLLYKLREGLEADLGAITPAACNVAQPEPS